MKGRTRWFRTSDTYPVRPGMYECLVRVSDFLPTYITMLEYDGFEFRNPLGFGRVTYWCGLTKAAHLAALKDMAP